MAGQVHVCSQAEVGESIEGENTFKRGGMTERTTAQGRHEMMEPRSQLAGWLEHTSNESADGVDATSNDPHLLICHPSVVSVHVTPRLSCVT